MRATWIFTQSELPFVATATFEKASKPTAPAVPALHDDEEDRHLVYVYQRSSNESARENARAKLASKYYFALLQVAERSFSHVKHVSAAEFASEGLVGLYRAIERYDLKSDKPFKAFMQSWAFNKMRTFVRSEQHSFTNRSPARFAKILRAYKDLGGVECTFLTDEMVSAIAARASTSSRSVRAAMPIINGRTTLNFPDSNEERADVASHPEQHHAVETAERNALIEAQLDMLNATQARIIELTFGLHGHREHTQTEIGQIFRVSHQNISFQLKKALEIIARRLKQKNIHSNSL